MKPKGLGRGLDALLSASENTSHDDTQRSLAVTRLQAGKYQPRTRMDKASLEELAVSHGDGSFRKCLNQLAKVDLLILDDFGLAALFKVGTESGHRGRSSRPRAC